MSNSWDWITMSPWLTCFSIICLIFLLLSELLIMAILCCDASRERPKSHVSKNKDLPRPDEAFEKDSLNKGNILKSEFGEPLPPSRRKALRNASWDFGTGTINSTGTIRSAVKSSDDQAVVKGSPEDTTAARPTSSLDLPSMFADTDRDWQIVTGRNTSTNGNHGEEPVGTQEEHEALASPENGNLTGSYTGTIAMRSPREHPSLIPLSSVLPTLVQAGDSSYG
jgi:hypothetical protein